MEAVRGWVWIFSGIAHLHPSCVLFLKLNENPAHVLWVNIMVKFNNMIMPYRVQRNH